MTEVTTGCQCPLAGFCTRHGINKNPHFHHLCQTNQKYFLQWENCNGINQHFIDCAKNSETRLEIVDLPEKKKPCACNQAKVVEPQPTQEELKANLPSIWEQAKSFTGAMVNHALNGFKGTPEELQKARIAICEKCPLFIMDQRRCGACGCLVDIKTKQASNHCPKNYW